MCIRIKGDDKDGFVFKRKSGKGDDIFLNFNQDEDKFIIKEGNKIVFEGVGDIDMQEYLENELGLSMEKLDNIEFQFNFGSVDLDLDFLSNLFENQDFEWNIENQKKLEKEMKEQAEEIEKMVEETKKRAEEAKKEAEKAEKRTKEIEEAYVKLEKQLLKDGLISKKDKGFTLKIRNQEIYINGTKLKDKSTIEKYKKLLKEYFNLDVESNLKYTLQRSID